MAYRHRFEIIVFLAPFRDAMKIEIVERPIGDGYRKDAVELSKKFGVFFCFISTMKLT